MGVPVVTLAGRTAVSRLGVSILSNVGLAELIARSTPAYVEIAARRTRDLAGLSALQAGLRGRMQRSPLLDAARFAHYVEAAYDAVWARALAREAPLGAEGAAPGVGQAEDD
jgi:predicted O-linked N-acetylglucosamine transferase (SPINDLY family)